MRDAQRKPGKWKLRKQYYCTVISVVEIVILQDSHPGDCGWECKLWQLVWEQLALPIPTPGPSWESTLRTSARPSMPGGTDTARHGTAAWSGRPAVGPRRVPAAGRAGGKPWGARTWGPRTPPTQTTGAHLRIQHRDISQKQNQTYNQARWHTWKIHARQPVKKNKQTKNPLQTQPKGFLWEGAGERGELWGNLSFDVMIADGSFSFSGFPYQEEHLWVSSPGLSVGMILSTNWAHTLCARHRPSQSKSRNRLDPIFCPPRAHKLQDSLIQAQGKPQTKLQDRDCGLIKRMIS